MATSVPSSSGTRNAGACASPMNCLCWDDDCESAWQWTQVLSEAKKEPMTNWPDLIAVTALPTSSTMPQYSCPIGVGDERADAAIDQVAQILMMASVGLMICHLQRVRGREGSSCRQTHAGNECGFCSQKISS
jgi:hypothetical protein